MCLGVGGGPLEERVSREQSPVPLRATEAAEQVQGWGAVKRASGQGPGTPAGLPLGRPQWGRVPTPQHEVGALPPSLSVVTSQVGLLMVPATQSRGDRDTGREPGTRPGPEPLRVHETRSLNPMSQVRATPRDAAWSGLGSWSAGGSSVGPPAAGIAQEGVIRGG